MIPASLMGQRVIEMENLTKIFGEKLIAVNNVNLAVEWHGRSVRGPSFGA